MAEFVIQCTFNRGSERSEDSLSVSPVVNTNPRPRPATCGRGGSGGGARFLHVCG